MDYFGLFYLSIFSLAWLFSLKDSIEYKEKIIYIIISVINGIIIISSVVLTWPGNIPFILKNIWKYVIIYFIVTEIITIKHEIDILPQRLKEKEDIDIEFDSSIVAFSIFISLIPISPGLYYAYKLITN